MEGKGKGAGKEGREGGGDSTTLDLSYDNITGCLFDAMCVQAGSGRSHAAVPLRRLSVGGGSWSTSAISWCTDMCRTADQDPVWWQELCCGWSAGLEQSIYQLHCVTLTVFTASGNSWRRNSLVAAGAHSECVLYVLQILLFTYLLTFANRVCPLVLLLWSFVWFCVCLRLGYVVVRLMIAETEIQSSSSEYGRDRKDT